MSKDKKIVLTLDAGGTNFVFSAICDNEEIVEPVRLKAVTTVSDSVSVHAGSWAPRNWHGIKRANKKAILLLEIIFFRGTIYLASFHCRVGPLRTTGISALSCSRTRPVLNNR